MKKVISSDYFLFAQKAYSVTVVTVVTVFSAYPSFPFFRGKLLYINIYI